ncbi:WD40-repeat-containing domain protein [Suillus ampliporus]|nr:WD40-repeat-containing domain protein [Suillus ampliporus]
MSSPTARTKKTSAITPRQKFEGHTDPVRGVIHLPDGQRIITCSHNGSLRVWNLDSGKQIGEDWRDGDSKVYTIVLSPDGKRVVSGAEDGAVRLWDIKTCKVVAKWTGHTARVWSVCWSRDGRRVVSGSHDGTARQWDVQSRETTLQPIKIGHRDVWAVIYSPDTSSRLHSSARRHHPGLSSASHERTILGRFSSFFQRTQSDAPSRPRPLNWARSFLTQRRRNGDDIELVEVPYAQGKRRNASAREKRKTNRLPPKNAAAGSSRPPQSGVTQQSSGVAHLQPSSQPQAAASTTPVAFISAPPPLTTLHPDATIRHPGRWTRFWLFTCCASPEYTDGRH